MQWIKSLCLHLCFVRRNVQRIKGISRLYRWDKPTSLEFIVQVAMKNCAKPHFRFSDVGKRTDLCGRIPQVRTTANERDQCHLYYRLYTNLTTHITKLLISSFASCYFTSNIRAYDSVSYTCTQVDVWASECAILPFFYSLYVMSIYCRHKSIVGIIKLKLHSMALVCKRTIPTVWPPLVEVSANFCG
jgi:hypothetical protein